MRRLKSRFKMNTIDKTMHRQVPSRQLLSHAQVCQIFQAKNVCKGGGGGWTKSAKQYSTGSLESPFIDSVTDTRLICGCWLTTVWAITPAFQAGTAVCRMWLLTEKGGLVGDSTRKQRASEWVAKQLLNSGNHALYARKKVIKQSPGKLHQQVEGCWRPNRAS